MLTCQQLLVEDSTVVLTDHDNKSQMKGSYNNLGPDLQYILGKIVSLAYVFPIYEELSKS